MAIIVRLEGEMPPVVVPPYSLDGKAKVSEVLEAACAYFKRPVEESQLIDSQSGVALTQLDKRLDDYGLGHWSLLALHPTVNKTYERVTFGG